MKRSESALPSQLLYVQMDALYHESASPWKENYIKRELDENTHKRKEGEGENSSRKSIKPQKKTDRETERNSLHFLE